MLSQREIVEVIGSPSAPYLAVVYKTQAGADAGHDGTTRYGVWANLLDRHLVMLDLRRGMPFRSFGEFTSAWSPRWSPDGTRLAFYAMKEGVPRLCVFRSTRARVSCFRHFRAGSYESQPLLQWSSDGHSLYASRQLRTPIQLASELEFHPPHIQNENSGPVRRIERDIDLIELDVATGSVSAVAAGDFRGILFSPAGQLAAALADLGTSPRQPDQALALITLLSIDSHGRLHKRRDFEGLKISFRDAARGLAFSPDERYLAYPEGGRTTDGHLHAIDLQTWADSDVTPADTVDTPWNLRTFVYEGAYGACLPPVWVTATQLRCGTRIIDVLSRTTREDTPTSQAPPPPSAPEIQIDRGTDLQVRGGPFLGATVMRVDRKGHKRVLWDPNPGSDLKERIERIALAQEISWRDATSGAQRTGTLVLPREASGKVPAIVAVYAGSPRGGGISSLGEALYPLVSRGYAVFEPDLPESSGPNPIDEIASGADAALDGLVLTGKIDPARLGLFGWSYGGYTIGSILTKARYSFAAAVAVAGVYDIPSLYLGSNPGIDIGPELSPEVSGQPPLGLALWEDPQRYINNSPVAFADRIATPWLLIHGTQDLTVPYEQSLEMYRALMRLKKPAELLTYQGRSHALLGPLSERLERWHEVFRWFDTYLRSPPGNR